MLNVMWDEWEKIDGFYSRQEGICLYDEVVKQPCGTLMVEIGCYRGRSTAAMLAGCAESSCGPDRKKLIIVDNFSGNGIYAGKVTPERTATEMELFWVNINRRLELRNYVQEVSPMASEDWFKTHQHLTGKISLFHIDGLHSGMADDIQRAKLMLAKGGVIVCHDFWPLAAPHHSAGVIKKTAGTGLNFVKLGNTNLGKAVV